MRVDGPGYVRSQVQQIENNARRVYMDWIGDVRSEIRRIGGNVGTEIVGAGDVLPDRAPPAPKPPSPPKPAPAPKPDKPKTEYPKAEKRKEDTGRRRHNSSKRQPGESEEAYQQRQSAAHKFSESERKANKAEAIRRLRADLAERKKGNITVEREAYKGKARPAKDKTGVKKDVPMKKHASKHHKHSASANIPGPDGAGPSNHSEHEHHHTWKYEGDIFTTGY